MRSDVIRDIFLAAYFVCLFCVFVFAAVPCVYASYVGMLWAFSRLDFWVAIPATFVIWAILLAFGRLIFRTIMIVAGMVSVFIMCLLKYLGRFLHLP